MSPFWQGVIDGLNSIASIYDPDDYPRPDTASEAFAQDASRIGEDFRAAFLAQQRLA